jgi:hypothetical protein
MHVRIFAYLLTRRFLSHPAALTSSSQKQDKVLFLRPVHASKTSSLSSISRISSSIKRHKLLYHRSIDPSPRNTQSFLHLNIFFFTLSANRSLPQVLEKIAALEVLIRMNNRLQLTCAPGALVFDLFNFLLMRIFEDTIPRQYSTSPYPKGVHTDYKPNETSASPYPLSRP